MQTLVSKLTSKEGETIDVLQMWRLYTADIVILASLGTDLRMTESAETHPFVKDVDSAMTMSIIESVVRFTLFSSAKWFAKTFFGGANVLRRAFEARERALYQVMLDVQSC